MNCRWYAIGMVGIVLLFLLVCGCTQNGSQPVPTTTVTTTTAVPATTAPVSPTGTTAATTTAQALAPRTYENTYFSIRYPDGWEVKAASDGNTVTITSPLGTGDNYQESMNVTREIVSGSPDQYSDAKLAALRESISNYNPILDSRINLQNGNLPARRVGFSGKVGTINVQWIQIYVTKDTAAYVLTFAAKDPDYRNFVTTRDEMFNSFRIK